MQSYLEYARAHQPDIVAFIRELVECESPSQDAPALNRFVELIGDRLRDAANIRTFDAGRFGKNVQCEFTLPGAEREGQLLALGHSDTVWSVGTLATMPWKEADGRLYGPGVLDMKSGIAFFVFAMRALVELDRPVKRRVLLQLNCDEEVGSETSRALTEQTARASSAVLVLEPGTGLAGKLKTARKGVGDYRITVKGRAAHAGIDFETGASAILELARQIERVASFTDIERGITVNPGVVSGGTRTNVVAAEARAEVDVRVVREKDSAGLDEKFRSLRPFDQRCSIHVEGGLNRPPMERTPGIGALFQRAQELAQEIGVELEESSTGGGSDGNFTAALGIATLDGLGGVGEGAHAVNESILVERIADRTALLAGLVEQL